MLVGQSASSLLQRSLPDLLGLDAAGTAWQTLFSRLASGLVAPLQCRAYRQQREAFWADFSCYPLPALPAWPAQPPGAPVPALAVAVVRDQSDAWLAEQALQAQHRRNATLLAASSDAVLLTDSALVLNAINPAGELLTGWTADAARGRLVGDVLQLVHAQTGAALSTPLLATLLSGEESGWASHAALRRPDGSQVPVQFRTALVRDAEDTAIEGLLMLRNTGEVSVMREAMTHLAWHDALTDLPNRSVFNDHLAQALALAARHDRHCAVLLVDVAGFQQIAEAQGQDAADELLYALALRLRAAFRRSDTVCRVGEARFGVVLPQIDDKTRADVLTGKALGVAFEPLTVKGQPLTAVLHASAGIFPQDGTTAALLTAHAGLKLPV